MKFLLGLEVQQVRWAFLHHKKNMQKRSTPREPCVKLSKFDGEERVDAIRYRCLVGSLRYLTSTRPDILLSVGVVSRFMEEPVYSQWKALKRIPRYIQGTISFGTFYTKADDYKLIWYSDSDCCGDIDDRKSMGGIYVFHGKYRIYLAFKEATDRHTLGV
ncbi:secreted RxLR effector protein 161-like [Andrographis paniculata]|uniref:secreted RxLR effector protein 161-like n=1 Tax=Andrographis paniculata TaxID=175694 RepID=UPI0021E8D802|nr:secreted RxLR effector protein 161-like [Andrographis paniculata]